MDKTMQDNSVRPGDIPRRTGLLPTEALNRFEPPEAFVSANLETSRARLRYGFRIANLTLLICPETGSEIVPMMPLATIPHGPAWLLGVINLRSNLVPVCDLRRVLGIEERTGSEKQMILVLDKGESAAGFVIDGHPIALSTLNPVGRIPNLPGPLAPYVKGALSDGEEVWLEFEHEGFLGGSNQQ